MSKRSRRRRSRIIVICSTVILVAIIVTGIVISQHVKKLKAFEGSYVRTIDLSDEAIAEAALFLSDVQGATISQSWLSERAGDISADVVLTMTKDKLGEGQYEEKLDEESYNVAATKAMEFTAKCLKELIAERLTVIGYADSVTDEMVDTLIVETFGMRLEAYLNGSGVKLLPSYEELCKEINKEGKYKANSKTIIYSGSSTEDNLQDEEFEYLVDEDNIILTEPSLVYRKQVNNNEK